MWTRRSRRPRRRNPVASGTRRGCAQAERPPSARRRCLVSGNCPWWYAFSVLAWRFRCRVDALERPHPGSCRDHRVGASAVVWAATVLHRSALLPLFATSFRPARVEFRSRPPSARRASLPTSSASASIAVGRGTSSTPSSFTRLPPHGGSRLPAADTEPVRCGLATVFHLIKLESSQGSIKSDRGVV
jgi:hypothetical protein